MKFITGIQAYFNIEKSIDVIYHINKIRIKNQMIISILTEREFYRI
jgi:hypothetical protein